jgi:hypothetical protein
MAIAKTTTAIIVVVRRRGRGREDRSWKIPKQPKGYRIQSGISGVGKTRSHSARAKSSSAIPSK